MKWTRWQYRQASVIWNGSSVWVCWIHHKNGVYDLLQSTLGLDGVE